MPPFQNRSTGAFRIAFINSAGVSVTGLPSIPSTSRTSAEIGIALSVRGNTPPPVEINDAS
jgi:hypothetical protein